MSRITWFMMLILIALSGCQVLPGSLLPTSTPAFVPSSTAPTAVKLTPSIPPPTLAPTITPVALKPWLLVPKELEENSAKPDYTLKLSYPEISGAKDPNITAFNQAAEKLAQDVRDSFQKDFLSIPADPNFGPSFAQMTYSVTNGKDGLVSVLFTVSFYASGAAHPNSYFQSLNFDLIHGKKIELANLFLSNIDYLKLVAALCVTDLTEQKHLEFLEGVQPKAENFSRWNISDKGLIFSFDPYQTAAYAMGPAKVTIPYAALAGSINPNGVLAPFLK